MLSELKLLLNRHEDIEEDAPLFQLQVGIDIVYFKTGMKLGIQVSAMPDLEIRAVLLLVNIQTHQHDDAAKQPV